MSEFRIEKLRRAVEIDLVGGATVHGEIFLQPTARYRAGPQPPVDLFNEPEPFVPVATGESDLVLIAKEQVLRVKFAFDDADTHLGGVETAAVDIVFPDGSVASGDLRLETRADRPRLLDFLNDDHEPFIVLRSPKADILINRRQIAQVRQRR